MARSPSTPVGVFPQTRMRRNRRWDWSRRMVRENILSPDDFIWPVFVCDGTDRTEKIPTMPGMTRYSVDRLAAAVGEAKTLGIPSVALFPATPHSHIYSQRSRRPSQFIVMASYQSRSTSRGMAHPRGPSTSSSAPASRCRRRVMDAIG